MNTRHRYDEPALLQEVEARLGGVSIPSLAEDLSLPSDLQARLAGMSVWVCACAEV